MIFWINPYRKNNESEEGIATPLPFDFVPNGRSAHVCLQHSAGRAVAHTGTFGSSGKGNDTP